MTIQNNALAVALCMLFGSAFGQARPVAQVSTVAVHRALIAPSMLAYGSVTFAQGNQTDVSLPYAAQITQLQVSTGQAVRRGEPLFTAVADPAAVLAYRQAQNAVTLAHGELQRTLALFSQRLATQSQVSIAEKALADAEQALAAQRQLDVRAAERVVRAQFDGVVTRAAAARGDRVAAGGVVVQLGRAGASTPTRVTLGIEPSARQSIQIGSPVTITSLSGLPGNTAVAVSGRVSRVQAAIDAQTRLVEVQVNVPASDGTLMIPGEPVQGVITLPGTEHWIVPRSSVLSDSHGDYVYQVDHGRARRVEIQVRVDNGERLGVDGALQPALALVAQGNYEIADNMAVREAGQ